jgi:hypothetical protein
MNISGRSVDYTSSSATSIGYRFVYIRGNAQNSNFNARELIVVDSEGEGGEMVEGQLCEE